MSALAPAQHDQAGHANFFMHSYLDKRRVTEQAARVVVRYEPGLKELREASNLSQEALARKLEVSRQTIANIERGVSEPKTRLSPVPRQTSFHLTPEQDSDPAI